MKIKKRGFTLIELLVVISIIALLSSVVLVAVQSAKDRAQITKAKSEINEFVKALEIYRTSYGKYPDCIDSLGCRYTYTRATDATGGSGWMFSMFIGALKTAKAYDGDLVQTLKNNSAISDISIRYMTPSNTTGWASWGGGCSSCKCGGKPITSEYLLTVTLKDNKGSPISLDSSYLSNFVVLLLASGYCSTVN